MNNIWAQHLILHVEDWVLVFFFRLVCGVLALAFTCSPSRFFFRKQKVQGATDTFAQIPSGPSKGRTQQMSHHHRQSHLQDFWQQLCVTPMSGPTHDLRQMRTQTLRLQTKTTNQQGLCMNTLSPKWSSRLATCLSLFQGPTVMQRSATERPKLSRPHERVQQFGTRPLSAHVRPRVSSMEVLQVGPACRHEKADTCFLSWALGDPVFDCDVDQCSWRARVDVMADASLHTCHPST